MQELPPIFFTHSMSGDFPDHEGKPYGVEIGCRGEDASCIKAQRDASFPLHAIVLAEKGVGGRSFLSAIRLFST
jgi:hypothetical protein